jgi:hypothetical protein
MSQPIYYLDSFGSIATPKDAKNALQNAINIISSLGGGILLIPLQTNPDFKITEFSEGITIVDLRKGIVRLQVPTNGEFVSGSAGYPQGGFLVKQTQQKPVEATYGADQSQVILQRNIHGLSSIRTELIYVKDENGQDIYFKDENGQDIYMQAPNGVNLLDKQGQKIKIKRLF